MYIAQGQGQIIPQGTTFWLQLKHFTTLIIHCKFKRLVFHTFWENDFSKFCKETHIWPCCKKVKGHPRIIIWTNLVDLASPILYTKSFLGSGKKIFKVYFFTIYVHCGHFVQWRGTMWTNCQYPFDRRPHVKSGENWLSGFREDVYYYTILYMYKPGDKGG